MSDLLVCVMPECGGTIDKKNTISLQTGCSSYSPFCACSKCGRVHSLDGHLVYNRPGSSVYLKDGNLELVLEPISFETGKDYLTKGYLYVCLDEVDEDDMYKMVELDPEVHLVFDNLDEEAFLFHGEDGTKYRLHRGDVNYVESI